MTTPEITESIQARMPYRKAQFGVLTMLVIGGIISGIVSHYTQKCLEENVDPLVFKNPGWIKRRQLKRRIWEETVRVCREQGVDPYECDRVYGADLHAACLAEAASYDAPTLAKIRAAHAA